MARTSFATARRQVANGQTAGREEKRRVRRLRRAQTAAFLRADWEGVPAPEPRLNAWNVS